MLDLSAKSIVQARSAGEVIGLERVDDVVDGQQGGAAPAPAAGRALVARGHGPLLGRRSSELGALNHR